MCSDNVQQSAVISASCSLCAKSACSNEPDAQSAAGLFAEFCSVNSGNPAGVVATTTEGTLWFIFIIQKKEKKGKGKVMLDVDKWAS